MYYEIQMLRYVVFRGSILTVYANYSTLHSFHLSIITSSFFYQEYFCWGLGIDLF